MKLYDASNITLDGQMNEAIWAEVPEFTDFRLLESQGGRLAESQTFFKVLPCKDRVYFGIRCMEQDMEYVRTQPLSKAYHTSSVELFLSPYGSAHEFYHFILSFAGITDASFFTEGGRIRPERHFAPGWNFAVHDGGDYWSVEIELPLTAFSLSYHEGWNETWLVNVARNYFNSAGRLINSTWCPLKKTFVEPTNFAAMDGFPMRQRCDDLHMKEASAVVDRYIEGVYYGTLTFRVTAAVAAEFAFTSDSADTAIVALKAGDNTITVPYHSQALGRQTIYLQLKRLSDGVIFKRFSNVQTFYEPIQLRLTLPECRGNFYPGQDYTKVVGTVTATKPVTVKLEGPGIETQVVTPGEDGAFSFETPNFELGEAWLTASIDGWEEKRKIRRLAPTGHRMAWISGGNLIVDGKPVLRRNIDVVYYAGGEAFRRRYDADNLHETKETVHQFGAIQPRALIRGCTQPTGEATLDRMPSEEMLRLVDERIEFNKDKEFVYYYVADEPEANGYSDVYLKNLYNYMADKDPYHLVLIDDTTLNKFIDCADWIEADPYLRMVATKNERIYGRPLNLAAPYIDGIAKLNRPDKCIGFLPTCFSFSPTYRYAKASQYSKDAEGHFDYPTFDEFICHTWVALNHGAKTLNPYAYHDLNDRASLYEGLRYLFSSVEALEDLLLMGKRTMLKETDEVEAVIWESENAKMFTVLNITTKPQKVTVDGLSGTWYNFRNGGTISGNTFELKPMELVIGTSDVRDNGLPTYAETAALIDKLENERVQGGGLLFNHYKEIGITTSTGSSGWGHKLFDGVRDNYGWGQKSEEEKFVELNLSKLKPEFTKVFVGGWHIEDAELKLRIGDELIAAPVAEVLTEEFSTTYILKEPVCPDALRLESNQAYVELYEIDVFNDVE